MDRVLASVEFSRAGRLSSFLRYVCIATLEQKTTRLTENHIGVAVFGRSADYLPAEDTIVRTTAGLLRKRLAKYYATEGSEDTLRIMIPRGSYVPVFAPKAPPLQDAACEAGPPADESPSAASVSTTLQSPRRRWRSTYVIAAGLVIAILSLVLAYGTRSRDPADIFWASLIGPEHETLLVPADSELVMYQAGIHREISLDDYIARRFTSTTDTAPFQWRRYTSALSVSLAAELGKLAAAAPQRFHVRYARDLQLDDLKHSNAILVGIRQANPWVHLFREYLNYHIDWDAGADRLRVRNDHPTGDEEALYDFSTQQTPKPGFALIAYTRNLSGAGHVLMIGGTSSAGTEAAIDFLLSRDRMRDVLKNAVKPDGSMAEFEILLQCTLRGSGSTDVKILSHRIKST